ncbi:MAG: hypothetical protein WKF37_19750 [Bryobacteraceae bacterium]
MTHPTEGRLALFAGGDLNLVDRLRTAAHLRSCEYCCRELEQLQDSIRTAHQELTGLPAGLRWDALAAEMAANIRLGVEAGECVGRGTSRPERLRWRAAAAMACVTALLAVAWWLNPPQGRTLSRNSGAQIRTTSAGLELNQNGSAMTLMHSTGQPIIVSSPGSLRARFVNAETGQITINNVYAD